MNWRYGIHPNNYAIGETEKYYSDMSEKGWELVKCGITLSRFQKTEPKKMRYRVEVVNLKSFFKQFSAEFWVQASQWLPLFGKLIRGALQSKAEFTLPLSVLRCFRLPILRIG